MRVLGIADSDSYVKWGAATLERMPADWERTIAVIGTPTLPSPGQLAAALAGTGFAGHPMPVLDLAGLAAIVAAERPDVVLLSVRGPVIRVLVRTILASMQPRPVIVSGLPGISIPATMPALYYRSQVDLFLLHSRREIREFRALADELGIEQDFGLATLPFLPARRAGARPGSDIVFAAQAKVPSELEDRRRVVEWLAETARRRPATRVVVKLRGVAGEAQTHSERYPYDVLLADLEDAPHNLVVSTGPMSEHLEQAGALVTVSSTAAIEAVAVGLPVLAIDDFGVSGELINLVFDESGLLASSDAMIAGEFHEPAEAWLDDNYFHAPSDETWVFAIEDAVHRHRAGGLQLRRQFRAGRGGGLRRSWDRRRALGPYDSSLSGRLALAIGLPLRYVVRRVHALRGPRYGDAERSRTPV